MKLEEIKTGQTYQIQQLTVPDTVRKHLQQLGLQIGQEIRIVTKTKDNLIFQIKASRLAISNDIIEHLDLVAVTEEIQSISLSNAPIGNTVLLTELIATGTLKRRLMDMGFTKGTKLYVKKVAPLGDPLEITLRGYKLSLRKSEAQLLLVRLISEVR